MLKKIIGFLIIFLIIIAAFNYNAGIEVEELYPKYLTEESKIIDIQGMPVHYRQTGSGPNLLLIHGVASSLHTWQEWHEILSKNFTVTSFDLPSFGLTGPNPKNDYSVEMYMTVMDELLNHLQIEKTHIAGNSFGGFLTWHYALHNPNITDKIILSNSAGIKTHKSSVRDSGFKLFINPLTKKIAHRFTPKFLIKKSLRNTYEDDKLVTNEVVTRYRDVLVRKGNREGFSEVLTKTILSGEDNISKIKGIKTPTLIIWGKNDNIIPSEEAQIFKEAISGSKVIIYENVGHLPMEEIPEKSAKDALDFLIN